MFCASARHHICMTISFATPWQYSAKSSRDRSAKIKAVALQRRAFFRQASREGFNLFFSLVVKNAAAEREGYHERRSVSHSRPHRRTRLRHWDRRLAPRPEGGQ